jgi:hypothetical protein
MDKSIFCSSAAVLLNQVVFISTPDKLVGSLTDHGQKGLSYRVAVELATSMPQIS